MCLKASLAPQRFLTEGALSLPAQESDVSTILVVTAYVGIATGI